MFSIITKKDYWQYLDSGAAQQRKAVLKDIQDAFILYQLRGARSCRILEMGGGVSRILPVLAKHNECWNVDKFEGLGAGPLKIQEQAGVKVVREYMGSCSGEIPPAYFDFVVSVSVVEHIPQKLFADVIKDCFRVLKPGGTMLHAIDCYLLDRLDEHPHGAGQKARLALYKTVPAIVDGAFEWIEAPKIDENVTASAHFACNHVDQLYNWHKISPALRPVREIAMSVSLAHGVRKRSA